MIKSVRPSEIKVGDKIRFTSEFLEVYAREVDPDYCSSLGEFQEVKVINVCELCPEEYRTFFFSKIPGDCYFSRKDQDTLTGIFEIEI